MEVIPESLEQDVGVGIGRSSQYNFRGRLISILYDQYWEIFKSKRGILPSS
jgi:hypothetical protein